MNIELSTAIMTPVLAPLAGILILVAPRIRPCYVSCGLRGFPPIHRPLCEDRVYKPVVVPVDPVGERPESVVNLWAAQTMRSTLRRLLGAVHGLSTRPVGLGPVRRTRPQVHRQPG